MPPENKSYGILITPEKALMGVAVIASTLIILMYLVMNDYVKIVEHGKTNTKIDELETKQLLLIIGELNLKNELNNVKSQVVDKYSLITSKLAGVEIAVFHMRRDKLLQTPIKDISDPNRAAIRQLERQLIGLGEDIDKTKFLIQYNEFD